MATILMIFLRINWPWRMIPSFATISCRSAGPLEARGPWHSGIVPPTKDGLTIVKSRAEPGSKWSCRQSDERHLTVDGWRSYDRSSYHDIRSWRIVSGWLTVNIWRSATTTRSSWSSVDRQLKPHLRETRSFACMPISPLARLHTARAQPRLNYTLRHNYQTL